MGGKSLKHKQAENSNLSLLEEAFWLAYLKDK